jgi:hypothetical protein
MLNRYFHSPDHGRSNACILDWRSYRALRRMARRAKLCPRNIFVRVPILIRFGEFAKRAGASSWEELPAPC